MSTADTGRKFHFLREIASGGFGRVYLAKVVHADGFSRLAAVKVLHPKWSENEEIAQRMRDEARLLGMLRHKNIVDVLDLTKVDGRVAVVMEYLEAVDLKVVLSECKRAGKVIPLKAVLSIFAAVASAMDAAYNRPPYAGEKPLRVIHRDIKPSNIMVDANGLPKVLDYGVARAEFEAREAKTAELSFGSVEYMSPERLFFEPESPASDVYSLGATLYEVIALEKFGKAKLRPDAHEQFVAERFEDLLERHPMPSEEVEDMLHDLLYDLLAFEENGRPTAADCVTRLRSFSRLVDGEGLEEWAEREVPSLVERFGQAPARRREGDSTSLVDRVLSEDTGGLLPEADDETSIAPEDAPAPGLQRNDPAVWDEMKQASLASLAGEGLGPSSSTWNPEAEPVLQKALGPPPIPDGVVSVDASEPGARDREVVPPSAPPPRAPSAPAPSRSEPESVPPPVVQRPAGAQPEAPVAPASPQPEPEYEPEDGAEGGGGRGLVLVFLGLFTMLVAAGGVMVVAAGVAAWFYLGAEPTAVADADPIPAEEAPSPAPAEAPSPSPSPAPAEAPEPAPAEAPVPEGPVANFTSFLDGTRKIVVRCDGGSFNGTDAVSVPVEGIGSCTVTALGEGRQRANAVVDQVEAREYACFQGAEAACE